MKKNDGSSSDPLNHVKPQRREFLAKLIAGGAALPVMSSIALAEGAGQGKGKGGKGKAGAGGKGKGGAAGKGKGGEGTSRPDPAQLAARLLSNFDKDGDKALNLQELTAALQSMSERRENGGAGKGGAAGKGKGGAAGKGKGKGNAQGGGVKPKKPGN